MTEYSKAARARLAAAYEAYQVSERARLAVPVAARDEDPASVLAEARLMLDAVNRYADAAVTVARLSGATWQTVAETLGLPEPEARRRFGNAESRFHELLASTSSPGTGGELGVGGWWRMWLVSEPVEAAEDLDDWYLHHLDGEPHPGPAPVSTHLT